MRQRSSFARPDANDDARERERRLAKQRIRKHFHASVRARWMADGCRCEGCGTVVATVETDHVGGKGGSGLHLDERWSSDPCMGAALCLPCHRECTNSRTGYALRRTVRWQAVERLVREYGPLQFNALVAGTALLTDPADVIRQIVALVEAREEAMA